MGVFVKFVVFFVVILFVVFGGMIIFFFIVVVVFGMVIIIKGVLFNCCNRFIFIVGFVFGYGVIFVLNYFENVFSYSGEDKGLQGFFDVIFFIMEIGFVVMVMICMILNLMFLMEVEDVIEVVVGQNQSVVIVVRLMSVGDSVEEEKGVKSV